MGFRILPKVEVGTLGAWAAIASAPDDSIRTAGTRGSGVRNPGI